ncbi:Hypothetical predicted protein, partial [Pelobates cultripes]
MVDALADLTRLETLHKQNPSDSLLTQLKTTRDLITQLSAADVARNLMWSKQRFYEKGNKADSLLARCLKKRQENKTISKIRTRSGETTTNPEAIAQEFLQYYTDLYNHATPTPTGEINQAEATSSFLRPLNLPTLSSRA